MPAILLSFLILIGFIAEYGYASETSRLEKARPVFQTFCTDIFHLGPAGCGQVGKLIQNILLWVSVVANNEAYS